MSLYEVDSRAQSEANHDIAAIGDDVSSFTADPAWQGALKKSLADLTNARELHNEAVNARLVDTEETAQVFDEYRAVMDDLLALYSGLRAAAQLFVSAYSLRSLTVDESGKRQRLVQLLFKHPVSTLERDGQQTNRTFFESFVTRISDDSETSKQLVDVLDRQIPDGVSTLKTRVKKMSNALNRYQKERDEDQSATEAVERARADLEQASQVHALVVAAILTSENRKHEISRYLLRRDKAYLARFRPRNSSAEAVAIDEEAS